MGPGGAAGLREKGASMLTRKVAGRTYNYDYCLGREGIGGNGFIFGQDLALGAGGSLYVLSRGSEFFPCHGITKCTLDHQFLWDDRGQSFCGGRSPWPTCVAVDNDETVYISDEAENLIFMYDRDGNFMGSWGIGGSGEGELSGPSGLAFDKEDNLYVVDSLNHRVQKLTKDGKFLARWGSQGCAPGQFNLPWGISIDKEGYIYVADWKNRRVQKLTPEGEHLASFGSPGTGEGELSGPSGVAVDDDGDIYVVDWSSKRLNVYAPDGQFVTDFVGDAQRLSPWAQGVVDASPDFRKARKRTDLTPEWFFERPISVKVDGEGRIMVLESTRHRIQVYVKERNFVEAQFNL